MFTSVELLRPFCLFVLFVLFVLLVSFVLFASLPSLQGRAGVRLFSNQPLSRHSRATLVPLRFFRFLRLPSVGLQTPETGLPPVPKVLTDLRDLRDPFPLGRTVSFSNPVQRYFKSPLCVPLMVKIFPKKCIFCVFLPLHKTI